jgi:hypothetical protein
MVKFESEFIVAINNFLRIICTNHVGKKPLEKTKVGFHGKNF